MNIFKGKELKEILLERNMINEEKITPTLKKYKFNDVIDEEKSVKWNREEIKRLNRAYVDECNKLNDEKNKKLSNNNRKLYNFIKKNYTFENKENKLLKTYIEKTKQRNHIYCIDDEVVLYMDLFELLDNILPKSKLVKEKE